MSLPLIAPEDRSILRDLAECFYDGTYTLQKTSEIVTMFTKYEKALVQKIETVQGRSTQTPIDIVLLDL